MGERGRTTQSCSGWKSGSTGRGEGAGECKSDEDCEGRPGDKEGKEVEGVEEKEGEEETRGKIEL
jgi:hypothetical protein